MSDTNEALALAAEPDPAPYQDADNQDTWRPEWRITDLATADWALSRVADLQREIAENEAIAAAAIERIRLKTQLLNERAAKGVAFFEGHLEGYAHAFRDELLKGGKKKTRALLHGSLGFKKVGGGLVVKDKDLLLEWAQGQPPEAEVLRIKEEIALDEIKRRFKSTGELPPGTTVAEETEEVVIKAVSQGEPE